MTLRGLEPQPGRPLPAAPGVCSLRRHNRGRPACVHERRRSHRNPLHSCLAPRRGQSLVCPLNLDVHPQKPPRAVPPSQPRFLAPGHAPQPLLSGTWMTQVQWPPWPTPPGLVDAAWGWPGVELHTDGQPSRRPVLSTCPSLQKQVQGRPDHGSSPCDFSCPRLCISVGSNAPTLPLSTIMTEMYPKWQQASRGGHEVPETVLPAVCQAPRHPREGPAWALTAAAPLPTRCPAVDLLPGLSTPQV